jgi:hypothetical protein
VLTVQSVWMLTWKRSYNDVACSYDDVAIDDMEIVDWQMWTNPDVTHGIILASSLVPRGPSMGCHMAPCYWVVCLKVMESMGIKPGPPHRAKPLQSPPCQRAILCVLLYEWFNIYLSLIIVY